MGQHSNQLTHLARVPMPVFYRWVFLYKNLQVVRCCVYLNWKKLNCVLQTLSIEKNIRDCPLFCLNNSFFIIINEFMNTVRYVANSNYIYVISVILLKQLFKISDSFLVFKFYYLQHFPKSGLILDIATRV